MHDNPFSPSFSIRPERFFGRRADLDLMRGALSNPDSPHRFLFVTGTRGCGKTSLLHQFALIARDQRWKVLETTYQDAFDTLLAYSGADRTQTRSATLQPSVSAAGVSASVGSVSLGGTAGPRTHLAAPFINRLSRSHLHAGLLITIDEVQKIPEEDMEEISHAVQGAKTQGLPIALVIAGLPAAYAKVRAYPGCTFIQRMRRLELGLMTVDETYDFLGGMFSLVPELCVSDERMDDIAGFCAGHPYLLQLVGSHVYEVTAETAAMVPGQPLTVTESIVREAERRALDEYQENILKNILVGMRNGTLDYLRMLCELCDDESVVDTGEVASALGKSTKECSTLRARIIDLQLAEPIAYGKLQLSLPYLQLAFAEPRTRVVSIEQRWSPRKLPFE